MNPFKKTPLLATIVLFALSCPFAATILGDHHAAADPSGTWVWESEVSGNYDRNLLTLDTDGSALSGRYQRGAIDSEIQNGTLSDTGFAFEIPIPTNNGEIIVLVEGKARGNTLGGTFRYKGDPNNEVFDWEGKRSIRPEDIDGTWAIEITSDQGQTFSDRVTFAQSGESLSGSYESASTERVVPVENPRFDSDFSVAFTIVIDDLSVDFSGEPNGNAISGTIDYNYQGQTGTGQFEGTRDASSSNGAALGKWNVKFVGDDGNTYEPSFLVEADGDSLKGVYFLGSSGTELTPTALEYVDETLTFTVKANWGSVTYVGQIDGDQLSGTVSYDYDGYQGSNPFTGVRE